MGACSRVDLTTLPAVPSVQTDKFLAGVTKQLDSAFAAVAADPGDVDANGSLAMMLQTYKQFESADTMYRRVRALDPDNFRWCYLHGVVLEAIGKPDEALLVLQRALEIKPGYLHAELRVAELLADREEIAAAAALYDEIMREGVPPSQAYFSHGKFLLRNGQANQAIVSFKEALRQSGHLGVAYYQLGLAYREQGKDDLAADNFRLAKRYQGTSADSADPLLNQLLPLNLSEQPFVHRAKILAEAGRLAEARDFIRLALERNPDSPAAHASMMGMAITDGDFVSVDRHFAKAVAIDPDNAKIYYNLGMARIAEKRLVEAERAFEKSRELDATDPNTHVQLGKLAQLGGYTSLAGRHLRAALELDPQHQIGNWLLGEWLLDRGQLDKAVEHLGLAVQDDHPKRSVMYLTLSKAQASNSAWEQAAASLESALDDARLYDGNAMLRHIKQVQAQLEADRLAAIGDAN